MKILVAVDGSKPSLKAVHGRSALGKALIGSTATKVLLISDLPVLLVK